MKMKPCFPVGADQVLHHGSSHPRGVNTTIRREGHFPTSLWKAPYTPWE